MQKIVSRVDWKSSAKRKGRVGCDWVSTACMSANVVYIMTLRMNQFDRVKKAPSYRCLQSLYFAKVFYVCFYIVFAFRVRKFSFSWCNATTTTDKLNIFHISPPSLFLRCLMKTFQVSPFFINFCFKSQRTFIDSTFGLAGIFVDLSILNGIFTSLDRCFLIGVTLKGNFLK